MEHTKKPTGLTSFALHLIAMALMLCDHLWATVITGNAWLTALGRLAFPIFAFLAVEGYFHTRDFKKYCKRLLVFALLSEVPFNLMYGGSVLYPYHQNVIWTLLLSLLCIRAIEKVKAKGKWWLTLLVIIGVGLAGALAATLLMLDYFGFGVLVVLVFYLFRGRKWWQLAGQLAGMWFINGVLMGGLQVPVQLFGLALELPQQGAAMFSLIPIWLYRGAQGPRSRQIQYTFYAFYPVHMLVLSLISLYWMS